MQLHLIRKTGTSSTGNSPALYRAENGNVLHGLVEAD